MPNEAPGYLDVYDVLPGIEIDYDRYGVSERDVIGPALVAAGYEIGRWFTGDGDSFGPLTRCVRATTPAGEHVTLVYG